MRISRRQFLLGWTVPQRSGSVEVEVMEVFVGPDAPSAFLIHHANEPARNTFGDWLRAHDGANIVCHLPDGTAADGHIFRVKMCFGRGLVLTRAPIAIRAKDRVIIN